MLALAAIVLFGNLSAWQLRRAHEKQAMLDAAAQVLAQRQPVPLAASADPARANEFAWSEGRGEFVVAGPLWLDNQQRHGRAGVRAYRLFRPEGGSPLLVDLGWLPLAGDRKLPTIAMPTGSQHLRGMLAPPPSIGLALGPALASTGDGWLMTRVDPAAIDAALQLDRPLAPRVLRLDPALPLGYDRDLELLANTLPPDKHRGYALQWGGLALAVLVTALILTFRRPRGTHKAAA